MRQRGFRPTREILLTADDEDALFLYATGLERDGFTVFSTCNPANAAAFVERGRPPNAVVVVASLRGADGWAAIDPVLTSASQASVPVVLVTPSVRPDGRHRRIAVDRGCAAFVAEPCAPDELCAILQRVLAGEERIVSPPL